MSTAPVLKQRETKSLDWRIGVLFAIGSSCFALGAMPGYLELVGARADGITFFVGSIFFTSAALLQFLQASNPGVEQVRQLRFATRWSNVAWWACGIQFVGTLLFNRSTFNAITTALDNPSYCNAVWSPDIFGCICFLVASGLACIGLTERREWQIAILNLVGSVAFGVSGIASFVVPDSSDVINTTLVNLGTFVGALGFLSGAILLARPKARTA